MWDEKETSVLEVRAFSDAPGAPGRAFRAIHIVGTSGKGSVCAYLTGVLRRAGYRVGTFVSPHLVDIRGRIPTDRKVASLEVFQAAVETMKRQGETEVRAGRGFPVYFEYLYYMAMLLSWEADREVVVFETGLGGRLNATDSYALCLTVLISVSLGHMQYLGSTVEKIAAEKVGIIKEKVPVACLDAAPSVAGIITMRVWEMQAPAYPVMPDWTDMYFASLPTPYQRENTALAAKASQVFSEGETGDTRWRMAAISFPGAVRTAVWTAHMQKIHPGVFLGGAHSADGVLRMVEAGIALAAKRGKRPFLLTSSVQNRELTAIVKTFVKVLHPACICLAPLYTSCGTGVHALADIYRNKGVVMVKTYGSVGEALWQAGGEQAENATLFVAGSLYLTGEILAKESK